jgi:hypothetical protein
METPALTASSRRAIASLDRPEREYAAPRDEARGGNASSTFKDRQRVSPRSSKATACATSPLSRARVPRPQEAKIRPY